MVPTQPPEPCLTGLGAAASAVCSRDTIQRAGCVIRQSGSERGAVVQTTAPTRQRGRGSRGLRPRVFGKLKNEISGVCHFSAVQLGASRGAESLFAEPPGIDGGTAPGGGGAEFV